MVLEYVVLVIRRKHIQTASRISKLRHLKSGSYEEQYRPDNITDEATQCYQNKLAKTSTVNIREGDEHDDDQCLGYEVEVEVQGSIR